MSLLPFWGLSSILDEWSGMSEAKVQEAEKILDLLNFSSSFLYL
jgi:hypothetical protein